ncbi:sensor histidine kinase [Argonema antarcticum]|uniref:sensor histidine kinase n=1 Tax=Argonema antarcticum TaxID=2942763 RepID=UPI002011A1E2|nr:HAMP domain-containing sensor histidine kinase [Argonema antarcticum]MCL1471879.1 HAMP domain-containing histidine kinase [Argonema antarcticum A004/B2]
MASEERKWILIRRMKEALASKVQAIFIQLKPASESAEYKLWRHRFLLERLHLGLWVALICLFTFIIRDLYNAVFPLKELQNIPHELKDFWIVLDITITLLLLTCLFLLRTQFGRRYPIAIFLGLSWSITLLPQVLATFRGSPLPDLLAWTMVFLVQATLIPVRWRLHLLSQLGVLVYYVGVNLALGLTTMQGKPIYNVTIFLYLFWFCFVCDLAVYLYERLQREEFESRRELRAFLHAVSHDLRNPVTGMSMVLQNLLNKSDDRITVRRSILERMLQGSDRQLNLINSLLEAHSSEVQGIVLHCEPLHLSSMVQAVYSDLAPILNKNQVNFSNLVSEDLPPVNADSTQLWRVFGNLITNAVTHNPPEITITINAVVEGKMIRCSVRDNGVGMSQEQCRRMFQLYARGSRSRYVPGLGLGLYLCRQIINAHGGQIDVNSSVGSGTMFWFTLPIFEKKR